MSRGTEVPQQVENQERVGAKYPAPAEALLTTMVRLGLTVTSDDGSCRRSNTQV